VKTESIFFGTGKQVLVFCNTDTARCRKHIVVTHNCVVCMSDCVRVFCKRKTKTLNKLLMLKNIFK